VGAMTVHTVHTVGAMTALTVHTVGAMTAHTVHTVGAMTALWWMGACQNSSACESALECKGFKKEKATRATDWPRNYNTPYIS